MHSKKKWSISVKYKQLDITMSSKEEIIKLVWQTVIEARRDVFKNAVPSASLSGAKPQENQNPKKEGINISLLEPERAPTSEITVDPNKPSSNLPKGK